MIWNEIMLNSRNLNLVCLWCFQCGYAPWIIFFFFLSMWLYMNHLFLCWGLRSAVYSYQCSCFLRAFSNGLDKLILIWQYFSNFLPFGKLCLFCVLIYMMIFILISWWEWKLPLHALERSDDKIGKMNISLLFCFVFPFCLISSPPPCRSISYLRTHTFLIYCRLM